MEKKDRFDTSLSDSQATAVVPVKPDKFNYPAYHDYEQMLLERCRNFRESESGVLVYRRMRVAEVFSYGCADMRSSLEWQLGALEKSMDYMADVPNFLEPWYGIGTIASAFGRDYVWHPNQAPAVSKKIPDLREALDMGYIPVHKTDIGKHTLEMAEYFMDMTGGRIPVSLSDMQSPLNVAENIVDINSLMTDFLLNPEDVRQLFNIISDLTIEFNNIQKGLIGDSLVFPGHGFASSRVFKGLGMSDDLLVMLPDDLYRDIALPAFEKVTAPFEFSAFHSCGNWSERINLVKEIDALNMIDAAFSKATDPDPNPAEIFSECFTGTGITVNARIVGDPDIIGRTVKKLWKPGMKLIVVTYCQTPEEQERAYNIIHNICNQ